MLLMSPFFGGYSQLRGQIFSMCGLDWWGGMNYINYLFKVSVSSGCDSISPTFTSGMPLMYGISLIVLGYLRKFFIKETFEYKFKVTIISFFGLFLIVSGYRLLMGYQGSWFFPDFIILNGLVLVTIVRMFSTEKISVKKPPIKKTTKKKDK